MENNKIINLAGKRFGRLTVMSENGRSKQGNVLWLCQCDCGKDVTVNSSYLITKTTMSCGCLKRDETVNRFTTHGKTKTRLYKTWASMIQRCHDVNHRSYKSYGGYGITVCDEWRDFSSFEKWSNSNGYDETLTIDRIDCYGNYCPENCQWISFEQNRKKHKDSIMLEYKGRIEPLKTWCDILGLPTQTIRRYYHNNGKTKTELGIANVIETGNKRYFNKRKAKEEMKYTSNYQNQGF